MKTVVIGGGTGSFTVLRGIKQYGWDISAIVSMFDNGGSTGKLRDEYGVLPPGDIRRCLVALAEDDSFLRQLFQYRFEPTSSVNGHSLGNLMLVAAEGVTGEFKKGLEELSGALNIRGRVLPVSYQKSTLCAEYESGEIIVGETHIDKGVHQSRISRLYLEPSATLDDDARRAILDADLIIAGPGDLYTSIIANLSVEGMRDALTQSNAKKVYICNLMTKQGETQGYSAADHVAQMRKYGFYPDVIVCSNSAPSPEAVARYSKEGQELVEIDEAEIQAQGAKLVLADITSGTELVRHDSYKLAEVINSIYQ